MRKDLIYLIEAVDAQGTTASFMKLMKTYVGDVGVLSFSGKKYEPIQTGDLGAKHYGIHFIVKEDPKKAVRIVFDSKQRPLAVQIWKNFGFPNSEMNKPDKSISIDQDNDLEEILQQVVGMLTKGGEVNENFHHLQPNQREAWKKLRQEVRSRAPSMKRSELIATYQRRAKQLGVSKSTFDYWIEGARSNPKLVKKAPAPQQAKPGVKAPANGNGDHEYRSPVAIMKKRGEQSNEIVHRMDSSVRIFTNMLKKGTANSLIVAGVGGVGKTHLVSSTLGPENIGKTWEMYKGAVTPLALYSFLYKNRHNKILVFDDTDVFKSDDMMNIFKAALDDKSKRTVSWTSTGRTVTKPKNMDTATFEAEKDEELESLISAGKEDKWKAPNQFDFTSRVVFITNKPMADIMKNPHLRAIASRSIGKVDYDFDDKLMLAKMETIWQHKREDIPLEKRKMVYDIIKKRAEEGDLPHLSLRTLEAAYALLSSDVSPEKIDQMAQDGML